MSWLTPASLKLLVWIKGHGRHPSCFCRNEATLSSAPFTRYFPAAWSSKCGAYWTSQSQLWIWGSTVTAFVVLAQAFVASLSTVSSYWKFAPWLVWLSGLSASLWTTGSPVRFPVRAHAWVAGQVPSWGCARGNHTLLFLSPSSSLPSPFSKNK